MKILYVTLELPYPPIRGAQIRDHALITRVAACHDVDLVAFCEGPPDPDAARAMAAFCRHVEVFVRPRLSALGFAAHAVQHVARGCPLATAHYVYPELTRRLESLIRARSYDVLQIEHSFMAPYREAARLRPGLTTVLSLHNVGAVQYSRMARLPGPIAQRVSCLTKARLMRRWEGRWADRFSHVIVVSQEDAAALAHLGTRKPISVVPNGVSCGRAVAPPSPTGRDLLFVGNLKYLPNIDAVRFFVGKVLPILRRSDARVGFVVAGHAPPPNLLKGLPANGVEIVPNPASIESLYERAAAVVVPLRAGGGTRYKILEALALGRPVVSTTLGAEGLGLEHGAALQIADTPFEMAARTLEILDDVALRESMIREGRRIVQSRFDWSICAARQMRIYRSLRN